MANPASVPAQPVRAATLSGVGDGFAHTEYDDGAWSHVSALYTFLLNAGVQAGSPTFATLKARLDWLYDRVRRVKTVVSANANTPVISVEGDDSTGIGLIGGNGFLIAAAQPIISWYATAVDILKPTTIAGSLTASVGSVTSNSARIFFPGIKQDVSAGLVVRWDATAGELVASSSRRALKMNERVIADGLDVIRSIQAKRYDTRDGRERDVPGFIAEDLAESADPNVAVWDAEGPTGVQVEAIVAHLVAAVQELDRRIEGR
jgi:hypothetical protein